MPFYPGESGNANGRPPGARNRRTEEVWKLLEARGDTDPLDYLSNYVSHGTDEGLRVSCANYILPFKHSKRGPTPAPRFVDDPIQVPNFTSIQEALDFQAEITRRAAAGELELQISQDISNLIKNWVLSVTAQDELQLKISKENPQGPQEIHIVGGLPSLPGTSVSQDPDGLYAKEPSLNGSAINGHGPLIEHQDAPPAIESAPSEAPDQ